MKRLSLNQLANLAEVVGAAAIVISLVYVGRELRANTAAGRNSGKEAMVA